MTTLFAQRALLADGWSDRVRVRIADGRIAQVAAGAAAEPGDEPVGILLPGVTNAHSHAFQRALLGRTEHRSAASADTFWTWREVMYRVAAQLGPDELSAVARQVYTEMLASGYTTVVEFHYLHRVDAGRGPAEMRDALLAAAESSGIRLVYLPVYYEQADFDGTPLTQAQERFRLALDAFIEHVADSARSLGPPHSLGVAAHSLRAVSPPALDVISSHAKTHALPMHLHVAEQELEVERALATLGARPVRWLIDNAELDRSWTLVHATHMDTAETADLAATGAVVCVCPSTEGNLGDGIFPLEPYLHAGGRIAIGSDSHVTIDPFEELRWLEYAQRLTTRKRNVAVIESGHTGAALFAMATAGGAQAAGAEAAEIAVGRSADLLSLDGDAPQFCALSGDALLDALVFGGLPSPVRGVMTDGRWRVTDGRHQSADEAASGYAAALGKLSRADGGRA